MASELKKLGILDFAHSKVKKSKFEDDEEVFWEGLAKDMPASYSSNDTFVKLAYIDDEAYCRFNNWLTKKYNSIIDQTINKYTWLSTDTAAELLRIAYEHSYGTEESILEELLNFERLINSLNIRDAKDN